VSPEGLTTALEVERTVKTRKRYEQILACYLMAMKAQEVAQVIWLCPTDDLAVRLRAIVLGITAVTVQKQRFAVEPAKHHRGLSFVSYRQWAAADRAVDTS
jgi:hypothetical protein